MEHYSQHTIPRTVGKSEFGPFCLYLGLGSGCAAFCPTPDRAIGIRDTWHLGLLLAKFACDIPRYIKIAIPAESYLRFEGQKKTKFGCLSATCQFYTHVIVYLETIRGIHYSELPISRIQAAWHSSFEVSSFDLYHKVGCHYKVERRHNGTLTH